MLILNAVVEAGVLTERNGGPFQFNFYGSQNENQARYENIGKVHVKSDSTQSRKVYCQFYC